VLDAYAQTTSPFDEPIPSADVPDPRWAAPELVRDVEYREWILPENRLRHPSWRGLRGDVPPDHVNAAFSIRCNITHPAVLRSSQVSASFRMVSCLVDHEAWFVR
jgi:hypothetical protein